MEPLTYRQMANEVKAIGLEKADALEKGRRLKRPVEMLAITQWKIDALRQVWVLLDKLAKGGEAISSKQVSTEPVPAQDATDDDDF